VGYILIEGNSSDHSFDLGLGSRLFAWAQASRCAQDFSYTVVIPDYEWVEHKILDLPNTILMSREQIDQIKWNNLIYHGKHISNHKYWRIKGMCAVNEDIIKKYNDPLWGVKFKSTAVNSFFSSKFDNFTGFHLRRWHGVPVPKKHWNNILKSLPNSKVRFEYYKMWTNLKTMKDREICDNDPPWITDKEYFNSLDSVRGNIYMSTDLPKELCEYYKKRYRNLYYIYDYIDEWEGLISKEYNLDLDSFTKVASSTVREVVHDLFDLFALSNCYRFILSYDSQWGQSAVRLNNRRGQIRYAKVLGHKGMLE